MVVRSTMSPKPRENSAVAIGSDLVVPTYTPKPFGRKKDRPVERSAAEMRERHQATLDTQPTVARCAFCDWRFEGPAAEAREQGREHREREHPEARSGRRKKQPGVVMPPTRGRTAPPEEAREAEARRAIHERAASRQRGGRAAKWTRETIVEAIRAYAAEHGHPPACTRPPGTTMAAACPRLGWKWADAVEAAGFPRPTKSTDYRKPLSAGATSSRGGAPAPSGPGVSEPAERALPDDHAADTAPSGEAVETSDLRDSGATRAPAPLDARLALGLMTLRLAVIFADLRADLERAEQLASERLQELFERADEAEDDGGYSRSPEPG